MKARKFTRDSWRDICHDIREDDGLDSRKWKKQSTTQRHMRQLGPLCKQVSRCLQLALFGCADEMIRDLMVVSVEPAPDATRLRVEVSWRSNNSTSDLKAIEMRLDRLKGFLRAQIAETVNRKRVPELVFAIVPVQEGGV